MHTSNRYEMPSYLLLLAITSLQTSGGAWHRINIPNNQPFTVSNGDAEHENGAGGEGCNHVVLVYQEEVVSTYYSER